MLIAINRLAYDHGLRIGQTVTAARAICTTLEVSPHDPDRALYLLKNLATALLRFSPDVVIDPFGSGSAILIEISRTTCHFGGEAKMVQQIRAALHKLSYHHHLIVAPRPEAASFLSRLYGRQTTRRIGASALEEILDTLPWHLIEPPQRVKEQLRLSGIQTLGELKRLPKAGMEARLGEHVVRTLELIYGERQEPLKRHRPPRKLEEKIEWWPPSSQKSSLLFAAKRLFDQLEIQLERLEEGVTDATLYLRSAESKKEVAITLRPRRPARVASHLLKLLDHKLESTVLSSAIDQLRLKLNKKLSLLPEQGLLFTAEGALYWNDEALQLMDKLGCRLGEGRVFSPQLTEDHRPEFSYTWRRAGVDEEPEKAISPPTGQRPLELSTKPQTIFLATNANGRPEEILQGESRGLIRVISGPERLRSGWWDGQDACRDYYVIQTKDGSRLWIYQDRHSGSWFRQGLFS